RVARRCDRVVRAIAVSRTKAEIARRTRATRPAPPALDGDASPDGDTAAAAPGARAPLRRRRQPPTSGRSGHGRPATADTGTRTIRYPAGWSSRSGSPASERAITLTSCPRRARVDAIRHARESNAPFDGRTSVHAWRTGAAALTAALPAASSPAGSRPGSVTRRPAGRRV